MGRANFNWNRFWVRARKVLNISWKVALVVIGIFAALLIFSVVWEQKNHHYGKDPHYWDRDLSENICVHVFNSESVCVYDRSAGKYVTPRLKWVAGTPDRDSLTVFCDKDGKRGFLNVKTGEIVIGGRYKHAWVFSEGLAAVVEPDGKMGFIDSTGEYVIAPELDYISSHDYVFKHGVCCIANRDGNQGLLNRDGEWALPQEYSDIDYVNETDVFIATRNDKVGLVKNGSFEWIYPVEYDDISWIESPTGNGYKLYKDFCSKHVSIDGHVIDSFLIDGTYELKYMVKYNPDEPDECSISDKVISFYVYGLYGVMDKHTGKVIIPAMYGDVEMVSDNLLRCSLEKSVNDSYVLYDLKGNKVE